MLQLLHFKNAKVPLTMKYFQARKRRDISWLKESDYLLSIGRQEFARDF